nr:Gal-binding and CUB domains containing receptor 14 [Arenicola marina]
MLPEMTRLFQLSALMYSFSLICIHPCVSEIQEVCAGETFEGRCESDEVIVMKSARYGRMRLGRCVKVDLGYLGCSSNVLSLFDGWCSGKRSCDVAISKMNKQLVDRRSCIADITSHVEVAFACRRVSTSTMVGCSAENAGQLTAASGTLASHVADELRCGDLDNPWVIDTSPGQLVRVSMSNFGWQEDNEGKACQSYAYISEPSLGVNQTVCGGRGRERQVYMSSSSHVVLQFIPVNQRELKAEFLLHYEVLGCQDITPPLHAWYKRNGSAAVVGCEWSEHSWYLRCEGNSWVGVVGNCSSGEAATQKVPESQWSLSPLLSVSLIIGLGVLVVALFCIALIGCICILCSRSRKRSEAPAGFQPSEQQQAFLYHPGRPVLLAQQSRDNVDTVIGHPASCTMQSTKPTATDELIHIWETPLPIPKQAQSSAGVTDNSATMSGRGTLPGPPHVYKDGSTMSRSDYSTDTYWAGTDRYFDNDLGWVTMPNKE